MTLLLSSAARAITGARSGQEDAFRVWPGEGVVPPKAEGGGLLAVLADGMGGHAAGEIAGQTACKTFTEVFTGSAAPFETRLKSALNASNEALAQAIEQNASLRGMGCTLVAAWIDDQGMRWTSVGDSLLLLYRLPDVIRLNADHSLGSFLDEQARRNRISRSEARRNRNRNALRSALTGSKIELIDLRGEPLELRPDDWIVLASDGICSLEGNEIADVIYRYRQGTPDVMADGLIAAVAEKGVPDQDNTTVVVVHVGAARQSAGDDPTERLRRTKGDDVELRTRRIGVSRPLRTQRQSRRAAMWLALAAVILISLAAVLLAMPSMRANLSTTGPDARVQGTTAPANATVEPSAPTPVPMRPPARAPAETGPPSAPPPLKPGRGAEDGASRSRSSASQEAGPAGEADDTATQRTRQPRASAAPPAATAPAAPGLPGTRSGPETEGGARSAASKPRPNPAKTSTTAPAKSGGTDGQVRTERSGPSGSAFDEPTDAFKPKRDSLLGPQH